MEEELAEKRAEWEDTKRAEAAKIKATTVQSAASGGSGGIGSHPPQFQSQRRAVNKRVTANASKLLGPLPASSESVFFVRIVGNGIPSFGCARGNPTLTDICSADSLCHR